MLVIRRRARESILVADDIRIDVLEVSAGRVTLGFTAPSGIPIWREEVLLVARENAAAAAGAPADTIHALAARLARR
jgi:carbon storage regulator